MKKIVVAINIEEELNDIVDFAVEFLEPSDVEISVFYCYEGFGTAILESTNQAEADEHFAKQSGLVEAVAKQFADAGFEAEAYVSGAKNDVAKAIVGFCDEQKAQLLIVGTHRPGRVERFILGSIAESTIRRASMPVTVVPRRS